MSDITNVTNTLMNGRIYSTYDNKLVNVDSNNNVELINDWVDLDDMLYNNHFIHGQCQLKVEFNRATELETIRRNLPIYPEDISFGATTNFANADILGRPGPIAGYVSTSDVTTRINLHLHRELEIPGNVDTDKNRIDELVSLIQACAYPKSYQNGLYVPIVTYYFGDTAITGKQTSWNVKWSGPKIANAYMEVTLDIAISHVPTEIPYFDVVKSWNPRQFK